MKKNLRAALFEKLPREKHELEKELNQLSEFCTSSPGQIYSFIRDMNYELPGEDSKVLCEKMGLHPSEYETFYYERKSKDNMQGNITGEKGINLYGRVTSSNSKIGLKALAYDIKKDFKLAYDKGNEWFMFKNLNRSLAEFVLKFASKYSLSVQTNSPFSDIFYVHRCLPVNLN
ncbi:hypothetical protein [Xanthovirga aplysinae]|uniref:hypothetical protein n=1 Tax=Xanthovirga aplysinae TaxID=2529853 RepID=UPI0012BBCC0A|nr:hypothetical protein [Xanthovirga aplysinae]MTI33292.1 hypothetical protein [Xanthovirga aplysinae]